jgi:hypothetical protein
LAVVSFVGSSVDPYSYALVRRGLNGVKEEGEDNDPSLVVGMQYSAAIGAMVLDKMSSTEDVVERLEQGLARVENASATNNDVQGVEMALGAEIHAVEGSLEEAKRVWGEDMARREQEWQEEKLAFTAVFLTQQQQIETLQRRMGDMMASVRTLQDREIERELGFVIMSGIRS